VLWNGRNLKCQLHTTVFFPHPTPLYILHQNSSYGSKKKIANTAVSNSGVVEEEKHNSGKGNTLIYQQNLQVYLVLWLVI
jgi:hypothetical protein